MATDNDVFARLCMISLALQLGFVTKERAILTLGITLLDWGWHGAAGRLVVLDCCSFFPSSSSFSFVVEMDDSKA